MASLKEAQELCGRTGRVGQVASEAKPFVSSIYGALSGSLRAHEGKSREAAPGKVATRRYRSATQWLVRLLLQDCSAPLRLHAEVCSVMPVYDPQTCRAEFDASPWGGAALLFVEGELREWFALDWSPIAWLQIRTGESKHQTLW